MRKTSSKSKLTNLMIPLYARGNNRYGTRNHVLVVASNVCCNGVVQKIQRHFQGVGFGPHGENQIIPLVHTGGCCDVGFDEALVEHTLMHMVTNPNFGGVLLVQLGCGQFCSTCRADGASQRNGKLVQALRKHVEIAEVVIQGPGGLKRAVEKGILAVERLIAKLDQQPRVPAELKLAAFPGVMNGSSDMTSPIANAAVGSFIDQMVMDYGRAAFGQTIEMLGAEKQILARAANGRIRWRVQQLLTSRAEQRAAAEHEGVESEPTNGNKDGGISTLSEKSLGTVRKLGRVGQIVGIVPFGQRASTKDGLHLVDTSGQDVLCLSGLSVAGCNLILFTTGRGAPTGAPGIPVIKITANRNTYENLSDFVDLYVPLDEVINDGRALDDVALDVISDYAAAVGSGVQLTRSEQNQQYDFQVMKYLPTA